VAAGSADACALCLWLGKPAGRADCRGGGEDFTVRAFDDEPWRAEIHPADFKEVLDSEEGNGPDKVEGIARLLRRVLPEPAKVISTYVDPA
jgi:hypothetical protein